ncbi:MAG: glyceraldehyde 3-phosphate dehydrogenase NAD-binding domain-containing protein, partial [bacterium]
MTTKVGINGFGRIGRQVLKAITDRYPGKLEVVAINDLVPTDVNANLLKYDSNYGRWSKEVRAESDAIIVDGRAIKVFAERDPGNIPWGSVGADIVIESTGLFTDATKAAAHKRDSVKKVIISAPAK